LKGRRLLAILERKPLSYRVSAERVRIVGYARLVTHPWPLPFTTGQRSRRAAFARFLSRKSV